MATITFTFTGLIETFVCSSDISRTADASKKIKYTGNTSTGYAINNQYRSDSTFMYFGWGEYGDPSMRYATMFRFNNEYCKGYQLREIQSLISSGNATLVSGTMAVTSRAGGVTDEHKSYFGACASSSNCTLISDGQSINFVHSNYVVTTNIAIDSIPESCSWSIGGSVESDHNYGRYTGCTLTIKVSGIKNVINSTYKTHVFTLPNTKLYSAGYKGNSNSITKWHTLGESVSSTFVFGEGSGYHFGNSSTYIYCSFLDFRGVNSNLGLSYDLINKNKIWKKRLKKITLSFKINKAGNSRAVYGLLLYKFNSDTTEYIGPDKSGIDLKYSSHETTSYTDTYVVSKYGMPSYESEDYIFTFGSNFGNDSTYASSYGSLTNVQLTVEIWDENLDLGKKYILSSQTYSRVGQNNSLIDLQSIHQGTRIGAVNTNEAYGTAFVFGSELLRHLRSLEDGIITSIKLRLRFGIPPDGDVTVYYGERASLSSVTKIKQSNTVLIPSGSTSIEIDVSSIGIPEYNAYCVGCSSSGFFTASNITGDLIIVTKENSDEQIQYYNGLGLRNAFVYYYGGSSQGLAPCEIFYYDGYTLIRRY